MRRTAADDENIRYKLNDNYFNKTNKSPPKAIKKQENQQSDEDDGVRYKLPTVLKKPAERKPKVKPKIKVNFWSAKPTISRLQGAEAKREKSNRRNTIAVTSTDNKPKNIVKVRKRVSFLPSPLFSENHIPMVTVPDDLTIHLNEEEAHDLGEDLNLAFVNSITNLSKCKGKSTTTASSPRSPKRKRSSADSPRTQGNENELEFFSKYVVQKLRKMETNQRIYSENLINTVLMYGQLGKLNGKHRITEA